MNVAATAGRIPSVSVILPVYNGARYLRAAIDSVIAQTLGDWELIAIDDGSTDDTPRILEQYADPRLVLLRQANAGEAAARNAGLDRARGNYIAFLDADDTYFPHALGELARFLDGRARVDVVYSDGQVCDQENRFLMRLSEHRPGPQAGPMLERLVTSPGAVGVPSCTMLRRAVIERHGARFDTDLVIGPDWDFWIQLARHVQFGYLDRITVTYRLHATNITRTAGQRRRREDLARVRTKVVHAPWFGDLSGATRRQVLYQLLIESLADESERQTALLREATVRSLSPHDQAYLWRQVGAEALVRGSDARFGLFSLNEAIAVWGGDWRSLALLWIDQHAGLAAARATLRVWRRLHREAGRLRALGRRARKQMPSALLPPVECG